MPNQLANLLTSRFHSPVTPPHGGSWSIAIQHNLHGRVVTELGLAILRGDYAPGETLPKEPLLIEQFDVSRTVFREAIKTLSSKGLLESRAKIGTRVRQKTDWNLLDPDVLEWYCRSTPFAVFSIKLQEMREMVEPFAAALAALSHTPEKMLVMEQAHAAMVAATDLETWVRADLRFHRSILDACGNELMTPLGALIAHMLEALLLVNAKRAGRFNASLAEHTRVLEAIRRRDGEQARIAMELLLGVSRTRLAGRGAAVKA